MSSVRFNPPPGWPPPPRGWIPPVGWEPPAHWPAAPAGWDFLLELSTGTEPVYAATPDPGYGTERTSLFSRRPSTPSLPRLPRRSKDRVPGDDGFYNYEDDDLLGEGDGLEDRFVVRHSRLRRFVILAGAAIGTMFLVAAFFTNTTGSVASAITVCGDAVRADINARTGNAAATGDAQLTSTMSGIRPGATYDTVTGEPDMMQVQGRYTTNTGDQWTFTCTVDATADTPTVLTTQLQPPA